MKILAIDTSCDESSTAIIDAVRGRLLSDVVQSHVKPMERFGGVVPEIASREHLKALPIVVNEALLLAGLELKDIDHIAVTNRPGLIGALLVGVSYAKSLAYSLQIPFTAHDHILGHVYSPLLIQLEDNQTPPEFPWICLVVSGGHTELFYVERPLSHQWLGGTLDDAAGEAYDKIGKILGLNYPAGPKLDSWVALEASPEDRTQFKFPRAKLNGWAFSFSGLKTAVAELVRKTPSLDPKSKLAIAASAQEAILDPLVSKLQEAATTYSPKSIVVTGGVASNRRLREKLPLAYFPKPKHCSDNAAMIALLAALEFQNGGIHPAAWTVTAASISDFGTY